jgi:hypothetical protein
MPRQLRPGAQDVHGVAYPAVWAGSDEAPRRVPRPRRAPPDGCKRPQAPEVQGAPKTMTAIAYQAAGWSVAWPWDRIHQGINTPPVPGTTTVRRRFLSHKLIASPAGTEPVRREPRRVSRVHGRPPSSAVAIFSCPKLQSLARCCEVATALITTGATWARLYYAQLPFLFTRVLRR